MIVAKSFKKKRDIASIKKGREAVHKIFSTADVNNDGTLDLEEFKAFSNAISASLKAKYGGAYTLTDE